MFFGRLIYYFRSCRVAKKQVQLGHIIFKSKCIRISLSVRGLGVLGTKLIQIVVEIFFFLWCLGKILSFLCALGPQYHKFDDFVHIP